MTQAIKPSIQEVGTADIEEVQDIVTERFEIAVNFPDSLGNKVPPSFLAALEDAKAGRVVDLDVALSETPGA